MTKGSGASKYCLLLWLNNMISLKDTYIPSERLPHINTA